jgi:MoaA/NifB/PqqE/SkfB family radical SAM enzyme
MAIRIESTSFCGASCIMCPRDKVDFFWEEMSLECFKKLVDETYTMSVRNMIFSGFGDPLMDSTLNEKLKYIKTNYPDFHISLISTGHLLRGKKLQSVCDYIDLIKISNYGFSKNVFESVHRGSLKYEEVKRNIDSFLTLKNRPFTIMTFLCLAENQHEVEAWRDYYETKCECVDIWKPHNWAGGGGKMKS